MKKHLKESLGWGKFNGSEASTGQPANGFGHVVEDRTNAAANGNVRPVAASSHLDPPQKADPRIQLDDRGKMLPASEPMELGDERRKISDKSAVPNEKHSGNQENSEHERWREGWGANGRTRLDDRESGDSCHNTEQMFKTVAISEPVRVDEEKRGVIVIDDDEDDRISDPGSEKKSDPDKERGDNGKLDRNSLGGASIEESSDNEGTGHQSHRFEEELAETGKVKRPRGRPPKDWKPSEAKKPRGRRSKEADGSTTTKRRVGRPRKNGNDGANGISASGGTFEPLEPEYQPGDLLWSKIGGAPFWPCMVTEDPIENRYYEQKRDFIRYYVQYFGIEVTHGWTQSANRVLPYEGVEAFREFCKGKIAKLQVKARQKFYDIDMKRSRDAQENWDQALREVAEAAAVTPASERYKTFRFAFYPGGAKRKNNGVSAQCETESTLPETNQGCLESSPAGANSGASSDSQSSSSADVWSKSSAQCTLDSAQSTPETPLGSKERVFNNNVGD